MSKPGKQIIDICILSISHEVKEPDNEICPIQKLYRKCGRKTSSRYEVKASGLQLRVSIYFDSRQFGIQ